jgi:hypothetical protein
MTPKRFVEQTSAIHLDSVFNPFSDRCDVYDHKDAASVRAKTLELMLDAASQQEVDAIWIGRDLGHRGGRRTGMALTDDVHVGVHSARWGVTAKRATKGEAVIERTATVIWSFLLKIQEPIFLWNVFPLHPFISGEPFTNRPHNARERRVGEEVLREIIAIIEPRRFIAIGNDAANVVARMAEEREVTKVRHPSYGGEAEFLRQIRNLYGAPRFLKLR